MEKGITKAGPRDRGVWLASLAKRGSVTSTWFVNVVDNACITTRVWRVNVQFPFRLHVSSFEGKTVEELVGSLTEPDPRLLNEVVVEAAYAASDPPLLPRLRHLRIPYGIDLQTVRFANQGFVRKRAIASLSYAPKARISSTRSSSAFDDIVRRAMSFADDQDPDFYLAPSLPMYAPTLHQSRLLQRSQELAFDLVGRDVSTHPVFAYVAPSLSVMRSPFAVYERLLDRPYDGLYVQPLRLHPRQDGLERLITYASFLLAGKHYGFRVVAGRAGTFGLVLMALGVDAVDSGLGERETYDLTSLDREEKPRSRQTKAGGRLQLTYLQPLMTSVPIEVAKRLLNHPALRNRFICELGECQYGGLEAQLDRPRAHFFHSRPDELSELRDRKTTELRIQFVGQRLREASDLALHVNRVLAEDSLPLVPLDHLPRWNSVLIRLAAVLATRSER